MSATTLRRETVGGPEHPFSPDRISHARSRSPWPVAVTAALAFTLVAALLRLFHVATSYNLFIDEATYTAIARDTTLAAGPMLHGLPFVLHPPIALLLLAGPAHVLGDQDVATLVSGLRPVVAIVGALIVAAVFLTLYRSGLRRAAFFAAAFVAFDPLIISFDSRVMLEAFAQLFAVLTIAAAIRTATATASKRWRWAALTALAGAATLGTKETFGLVILVALLLVVLTAPRGNRRPPLLAVAGSLVGYALINGAMINWGGFALWWHMRTDGLTRLIGAQQSTGFKAAGVQGSFWERLIPNGSELGATYAILAIGGISALSLIWDVMRRRSAVRSLPPVALAATRIVAIWAICACGYVAYAVVFGSLEEQMFYIAAVPCSVALAIRVFFIGRRVLRRAAIAGLIAVMLAQLAAWTMVHTASDDVYTRMLGQISSVAPTGSTISVTEETAQFVLTGYDLGQWTSVQELQANNVEYVLLSDRLVEHGYGLADQAFAEDVQDHGSLVLSVTGRTSDLQLYDVRNWTGVTATKDGA